MNIMNLEKIKNATFFVAKWWNPLFWAAVILAPVLFALAGIVAGSVFGMLNGYEQGLEKAFEKMHIFNTHQS